MWFYCRSGATIKHRHNCKIWQRENLKLQSATLKVEVENVTCWQWKWILNVWEGKLRLLCTKDFWQMRVKIETRNCNYVTLKRAIASPYKSWDLDDKLTKPFSCLKIFTQKFTSLSQVRRWMRQQLTKRVWRSDDTLPKQTHLAAIASRSE